VCLLEGGPRNSVDHFCNLLLSEIGPHTSIHCHKFSISSESYSTFSFSADNIYKQGVPEKEIPGYEGW